MKSLLRSVFLLLALAVLAPVPKAPASGSYCACLPKPPSRQGKVDRDLYDAGQKIYNGKSLPTQGDAAAQKPRLEALQAQLPERVARKKNLRPMAGTLTDQQLNALEYYVNQRYPKSK
jgi:hypothetical protein